MERHLMAVCVVCLLCVDHLPCQQHINNDNSQLFSIKTHEHFMQNTHTKNNQLHNNNHNNIINSEEEKRGIKINKNIYDTEEKLYNMKAFDENSIKLQQHKNKNSNINIIRNNDKNTATTDNSIDANIYLPNDNNYNTIKSIEQQVPQHEQRINNIKFMEIKNTKNKNINLIESPSEDVILSKTKEKQRYKRHSHHNHDDNDDDISSFTKTLLRMPKITQEYLKNIFMEYGGNNMDNATITLKNFQRLLHQLGLNDMLHENKPFNTTTSYHNHMNRTNIAENNTCITETSLLQLVQKSHNKIEHEHQPDEHKEEHLHQKQEHEDKSYNLNREDVFNMCPVLLYQLASPIKSIRSGCIKHEQIANFKHEEVLLSSPPKQQQITVWIYSFISVFGCSILGLVGVAIIPFMDSRYYQHIIHFLVALAVGTMTGDALLHLLPHSLSNQSESQMLYKGLVCMSGILFFYITEHGLTMISEWRKSLVKKDPKNNKCQMAKVLRNTSADATTTTRHTPQCAPIMGNNGGNVVASAVNDKVCKSKYSSYPYCYDEIAMDMLNDWLHLPKNANFTATTTTTTATINTITTNTPTTTSTTINNDLANLSGGGSGCATFNHDTDINRDKFERRRNGKKTSNSNDPVEMSAEQSLLTEQQQQQNHCPHNHHHERHQHNHNQQQYNNYDNHHNNDLKLKKLKAVKDEHDAHQLENAIDIDASGDNILLNDHNDKTNGHNTCNCNCNSCDESNNANDKSLIQHNNHGTRPNIGTNCISATANRDNEPVTVILREHEATHHGHSHKHGHVHSPPETLSAVAWMIIMGDGLHNFTDGMAIGAAFAESTAGGFSTALAVFCHELPHELGDFAILMKAGMSVKSAVFYNLLTGVLSFVGMIFGITFGQTQETAQWIFALAAGLFIYIALVDMMPEISAAHKSIYEFLLQILGISSGVALMLLIAIYEDDLKNIF